jgi:serine/threonine protein kinase
MPAPATAEDFLDLVRKSNQIDNARLEAYLRLPRRVPLPTNPRKLASQLVRDGLITNFQAEQFLLGKYKGFTLGGYRILERLGTGGVGTVYLAEHELMKRRVALKVLPVAYADDPALLERFRREARSAALLNHPHIVHVFDFRQEGSIHFLVMEYIEGPNLQQLIERRGPLPVSVACDYARQAALGLHYAHEQGLIHRDIKPANLLVDPNGIVKVLDLGLARFRDDRESSVTRQFNSKVVLGTADYLSPEQALDQPNLDGRSDIYSLGATLFALLTGRPPFHEGTIGQKLMWHQTRCPQSVTELRPDVPKELANLVARMLAKSPEDRPASCAEVADQLQCWIEQDRHPLAPTARSLSDLHLESLAARIAEFAHRPLKLTEPTLDTVIARAHADTSPFETPTAGDPPPTVQKDRIHAAVVPHRLPIFLGLLTVGLGALTGVMVFLICRLLAV